MQTFKLVAQFIIVVGTNHICLYTRIETEITGLYYSCCRYGIEVIWHGPQKAKYIHFIKYYPLYTGNKWAYIAYCGWMRLERYGIYHNQRFWYVCCLPNTYRLLCVCVAYPPHDEFNKSIWMLNISIRCTILRLYTTIRSPSCIRTVPTNFNRTKLMLHRKQHTISSNYILKCNQRCFWCRNGLWETARASSWRGDKYIFRGYD